MDNLYNTKNQNIWKLKMRVCVFIKLSWEIINWFFLYYSSHLKESEHFLHIQSCISGGEVINHVKSNGFGERSALPNCNNIPLLHILKTWWAMDTHVGMSLLISLIFFHETKVISSDNDGSPHFSRNHQPLQNSSSNWHTPSEWTFLIDIWSINGSLRSLES